MKPKVIKSGEPFTLHNVTFTYHVEGEKIIMVKVADATNKDLSAEFESNNKNAIIGKNSQSKNVLNKKQPTRPTIIEVSLFFSVNGYSKVGAELAFNYYNDGEWTDRNGDPVINWKQKMRINWFKPEYKIVDNNTPLSGMVM